MSTVNMKIKGGEKLRLYLAALEDAVGDASGVRVGFLENATYPAEGGQPTLHVAQVAFWNEFGTSSAPARPFFRGMISRELAEWGAKLGKYLRSTEFQSDQALALLGTDIKDALTNSIASWPGDNARATIERKGFDHGLVDKGIMMRSPDFEVLE